MRLGLPPPRAQCLPAAGAVRGTLSLASGRRTASHRLLDCQDRRQLGSLPEKKLGLEAALKVA